MYLMKRCGKKGECLRRLSVCWNLLSDRWIGSGVCLTIFVTFWKRLSDNDIINSCSNWPGMSWCERRQVALNFSFKQFFILYSLFYSLHDFYDFLCVQHHECLLGDTVWKCALLSPFVRFMALRLQRHNRQSCWREIGDTVRCSHEEVMMAGFSPCLPVWAFRIDRHTTSLFEAETFGRGFLNKFPLMKK